MTSGQSDDLEMEMYQEGAISNTYICVAHPCTCSQDFTIQSMHDETNMALMSMQKAACSKTEVDRSVWIQKVKALSNGWLVFCNQYVMGKSLHHVYLVLGESTTLNKRNG